MMRSPDPSPLPARGSWRNLERQIVTCERCPRLRRHCTAVARERRRAYRDETYWARPVPGFGDRKARLLLVGLAPGAHGSNRTGRMFTGDDSGRWLYGAMFEAGIANRRDAIRHGDGLRLHGAFVSAAARCAPPGNRPTRGELARCQPFLEGEWELLAPRLRVVLALGRIGFDASLRVLARRGIPLPRPRPAFAHGAEHRLHPAAPVLLASYHPSRQNTQTGRLSWEAFLAVIRRAARLAGEPPGGAPGAATRSA